MMLQTLVGFCVVSAAAQSTKPVDADALLADDECAGGDAEVCALNAIQLRGGKVKDVIRTMTTLEAANEAEAVTAQAAAQAQTAADRALAIALELGDAQAAEEAAQNATAQADQISAKAAPETYVLTPAEAASNSADEARIAAKAAAQAADATHAVAVELRRQNGVPEPDAEAAAAAAAAASGTSRGSMMAKEEAIDLGEEAAVAADAATQASESLSAAIEASMAAAVELGDREYEEQHPDMEYEEEHPAAAEEAANEAAEATEAAEANEAAEVAAKEAEEAEAEAVESGEAVAHDDLEEPDELPVDVVEDLAMRADTYPDLSTGPDEEGPYTDEPSEEEAIAPRQLSSEYSLLQHQASGKSNSSWGTTVCSNHQTGYYCDGNTQIRCCQKNGFDYVKCGSTWHSTSCGWSNGVGGSDFDSRRRSYSSYTSYSSYGGDARRRYDDRRRTYYSSYYSGGSDRRRSYYSGGGGWTIHPGWHQSSYCTSHRTGNFCSNHHTIRCCNDRGHYVDCTTRSTGSDYC